VRERSIGRVVFGWYRSHQRPSLYTSRNCVVLHVFGVCAYVSKVRPPLSGIVSGDKNMSRLREWFM
jgi:hypothetical protein